MNLGYVHCMSLTFSSVYMPKLWLCHTFFGSSISQLIFKTKSWIHRKLTGNGYLKTHSPMAWLWKLWQLEPAIICIENTKPIQVKKKC